ncbi:MULTISPECIES: DDE-type integrase/transposase/recombinase [Pseudoalteromonas]|uniref:DDE-type integrase/transposase/recombinase n=1 Tax=Pseudoalteromonas TaxID=53246 RepID=UPI0006D688E3|nr:MULTISPECIES: DDE-type integrase/transposase/recombinase [Pseudoalteromonas]KPZ67204.1 Integrase core domain protein [Pseudoalteromonas sp. P1-26]MDK9685755.1 DDE-type integrase/transposase/recombinase [Pseudoalteromonas shioyasakiensis]
MSKFNLISIDLAKNVFQVGKLFHQNLQSNKAVSRKELLSILTTSPRCKVVMESFSQFNPPAPNQTWASDITYVRTYDGFLYVATVMDLFSRRIVGWSMDKNMDKNLVIKVLLMAVYQRQSKTDVLVHIDQGSQYGSADYLAFTK